MDAQGTSSRVLDQKGGQLTPTADEYLNFLNTNNKSELAPLIFPSADEKMLRIQQIIKQIADTDAPVLVTGESGTGKEVVAKAIHNLSSRRGESFVAVNCAAIPDNLLESELFGFEKGAFTGAHQRHLGKFEQAKNTTLLLDEVTEIGPHLQAKLLRALQENEIERIGGSGPVRVNPRIVATSNRDILRYIKEGRFRQDLYYRLYVIHLEIPPLRQRKDDIPLLANYFLETLCKNFNKPKMTLSEAANKKLSEYFWPGNVRQLENTLHRAIIMSPGTIITESALNLEEQKPQASNNWTDDLPVGKPLRDIETQFILKTLEHHNGNRTHAAKTLGISLRTLRNKINEYTTCGIDVIGPANGRT